MIKYAILLALLSASAHAGQIKIETRDVVTLSVEEYAQLQKGDPVLEFVAEVNTAASKDPLWSTDYRAALCKAFQDKANQRIVERWKDRRNGKASVP